MTLTPIKFILWSAISTLWLVVPGQYVLAQSQIESQGPCQRLIQLSWRYATTEEASSSQELLRDEVEAVCLLNNEQPRTDDDAIAADDRPSPEHFTLPSLWWQQQQMINERLIDSWRAYSTNLDRPRSHVDVVVNGQIWPSLNYLERYWLLTQFGESAKTYGYQLRIFTGNRPVGLQVCDFSGDIVNPINPEEPASSPKEPAGFAESNSIPVCAVVLNYFDQGAIRGNRQR